MVNYIYGRSGSGKTTLILKKASELLKKGRRVFVLVPEQMMLETEKSFTDYTEKEGIPTLKLEIVSFRRLANRVFRTFGGLSYNYIGYGGRALVMWHALCECSGMLKKYSNITLSDRGTLFLMLSAIDELKNCAVTPDILSDAADKLEEDGQMYLADKVHDISLVYSVFNYLIQKQYDDPTDDLMRLNRIIGEKDCFSECDFFCDSFYGYTQVEFLILEQIMRQCDNFTVTLPISPDDSAPFCDTVRETERRLLGIERKNALLRGEIIVLEAGVRFKGEDLRFLESRLWNYGENETFEKKSENITLLQCEDPYDEAEKVAATIISKIREGGGTFSEHVIILRDVSPWKGIIDAVLEKNGIPYFMSVRQELTSKPLVRLVLSALSCVGGGWQCDDIMTLIKTGLTGISPDECDTIENYATSWRINGKQWYADDEWMMNPDGYTGTLTDRGARILASVNDIRHRIVSPLAMIPEGKATVKEYAEGIYNYMISLGIEKILENTDEEEPIQLFDAVIDALDTLVTVTGGTQTTATDFAKLFLIGIEESDIGRIPTGTDVVTIGSSTLLRTTNCRHVYVLGVNEGVFPAAISDDGFFCDSDRVALEGVGIELFGKTDTRVSDELLYFYCAVTSSSDTVTVSCSAHSKSGSAVKPSMGWERIRMLFPQVNMISGVDLLPEHVVQTKQAALKYISYDFDSAASIALTRILSEDGEYASRIVALKKRFTADADKDVISAENMPEMLKKSIVLSSSSIESYAKCAFSYFCKYLLNLKSMSVISFGGADVGNYMHFVLEKFVSAVRDGAIDTALYDSEQIGDFIDSVCDEYKEKLFGKNVRGNARNEHLFRRLRRTAVLLTRNFIDEFNVSEFRPVCFELPISFENDAIHPSAVELPSGGNAYLSGRIDRVDTYRRNGELFVKVIDYKTGKNRFSEEEMKLGLNIQLPLYLFSLCETDDKTVRRLGGENGDKIVPAAAFYLSARTPEVKEDSVDDSVIDAADMLLSRNGILLNEEELIEAMDSTHSGRFIPVKYKKNGEVSYRKNGMAFSREGFEQLHRQLNSVVCKIADGIKSGDASVRPLRYKETDACEYCHMKPICRFDRFNDN